MASGSLGYLVRGYSMKIFAHHDPTGAIRSLVGVDAPEGVEAMLEPEPGVLVTEIQGVDLDLNAENVDAVRELLESHIVAVRPTSPGSLVKKD
jgi:hypothetical protein